MKTDCHMPLISLRDMPSATIVNDDSKKIRRRRRRNRREGRREDMEEEEGEREGEEEGKEGE